MFARHAAGAIEVERELHAGFLTEWGRARMHAHVVTRSRYEWLFWDAAWRRETWPV